jgi:hypothetical protein
VLIPKEHLNTGHIIGVTDAYGSVQSEFTGKFLKIHRDIWPLNSYCRWRWSQAKGITDSVGAQIETQEALYEIQNHLNQRYGIQFNTTDTLDRIRTHDPAR